MQSIRRCLAITALLLLVIGVASAQPVQPYRSAPLFSGQSLPEPPHQRDPWSPPVTKLPEACVTSIQALIKYGFANPGGCEYREVELPCGSVTSATGYLFKTHAWVFPADKMNVAQRFVVAWNGMIYPAAAVGEAANLNADIAALVKQPVPEYRSNATMESDLLWHQTINELKVCMLLFLSETEAAEQLWQVLQSSKYAQPEADPYLRFAHQFTWANYDRAICAHMRGDDVISLLGAQAAARLRDNIERDAAARGLKRPPDGQGKPVLYLDFLKNIDLLVADEQRRVRAENVQRVLELGVDRFPDQKQRIAALIRDLEVVNATQNSQPGGVDLGSDPTMRLLVQQGEAAIDPLLTCFETDTRLTRSVGFGRDFHTGRYFLGVDDAAYRAICDILKVRTFGRQTEHPYHSEWNASKRAEVAKEIRTYWNKVRGVSELDRWYQTLVDDKGTAQQWLEAAKKIVTPVARTTAADVPPPIVAALLPQRPLNGELLRPKTNPTISYLLAKRAAQVAALNHGTSHRVFSQRDACEITLALAKWEPRAAIPSIHERIDQCNVLFHDKFHAVHAQLLAPWMSRLCVAGIDAGDDVAANLCVAWMRNLSPERLDHFESTGVFYALCRFPNHPKLTEAANFLFLSDSPYRPLHKKVNGRVFQDLLASPLIGVPAFRSMIQQELQNRQLADAKLTIDDKQGSYSIIFGGGGGLGGVFASSTDLAAAESQEISLRVCDLYAQSLMRFEGTPVFEAYWKEDRRDAAISELIAFLDLWGDCFRLLPAVSFERLRFPWNQVQFHLPKLDTPATPDDAKQGRAIFSLQGGNSEVRQVALPMFPQMARWKTLDKFPIRYRGKKGAPANYDRAGYIWQAEEIQIDGQWKRFYGFVGNHIIAKVPADEIEFLQGRQEEMQLRW